MENYYAAALQSVSGIGRAKIQELVNHFGSAQQAWQARRGDLFLCGILDSATCNNLIMKREKLDVESLKLRWDKQNIHLCTRKDPDYPPLLAHIYQAPYLLFYRGHLPSHDRLLAMVGSRQASAYGKNAAHMIAAGLAESGYWVVSGAARGIDTAAHQGALARGHTIAVLGCGVNVCYPPENRKLFGEIVECGAVVSEYFPETTPHSGFFPARNRIISGMSRGVVVVEADRRSGSLITADRALEEGRDVYAVPGSIFSPTSRGTNHLIQQGAKLVQRIGDIIEDYEVAAPHNNECELAADEQQIIKLLNYETPVSVEEIVTRSNLALSSITYILLQLELRGLVVQHGGQGYVRSTKEVIQ